MEGAVITHTLQKDPFYVFPEKKLRGLVPNSYILLSLSDLYIPTISPPSFGAAKKK